MQHHEVIQGTPEWDDLRLNHLTASEAPVMMASHPNMKRDELLEAKATQTPKEFSSFVIDVVFAKGHETEALARPIVEEMIGEELYPVTGSNGVYLSSYDGLNMLDTIAMEHKQWAEKLAEAVRNKMLPDFIKWQLEHQFKTCDTLEKIIFVVSDGTKTNFEYLEYTSDPAFQSRLVDGWDQFKHDLERFVPAVKKAQPVGNEPESLPTLVVEIDGELTTTGNLEIFKTKSLALIAGIQTKLETDQDFANAATTVKYLTDAEKRIELVKEQSLAKTMSLEEVFKTLDDVKAKMRTARLSLNNQVKADKENRKNQMVKDGTDEVNVFIVELNKEFEQHDVQIVGVSIDLYGAIKGKSSFDNMQSAINDAVARFKIECNQRATFARQSLAMLNEMATDYMFLFPNKQELAFMEKSHLKLTIESKINSYKEEAQAAEQREIARCRTVVENFVEFAERAEEFDDLTALVTQKRVVEAVSTDNLGDFTERAKNEKAKTLAALDKKIASVNQRLQEQQQAASQEEEQEVATQQTVSHQAIGEREVTEIPASTSGSVDGSPLHDNDLPGHDDLDDEPTYKVTVTPEDMRGAMIQVLGRIDNLIASGNNASFDDINHWRNILLKVV